MRYNYDAKQRALSARLLAALIMRGVGARAVAAGAAPLAAEAFEPKKADFTVPYNNEVSSFAMPRRSCCPVRR